MGILIGMDEAGYGPNLGPLVVAATAWQVADCGFRIADCGYPLGAAIRNGRKSAVAVSPTVEIDLYRLLRRVVARSASDRRIAIADSKILYRPGLGLRQLERGLHAVLLAMQRSHDCWSALVDGCAADPVGHHRRLPWHDEFNCAVPVDATSEEVSRLAARLARACEAAEVRPLVVRARLVYPAEFNELVEYYGTKGGALSHVTVGLLREVIDLLAPTDPPAEAGSPPSPQPPIFVVCDKHGGRNYYTSLLQHHFSEHWIEPVFESRAESHYEWGPAESRVWATFRVGGESFLPTALASMTAKYLRELAMRAWNEFWCSRVKDLRPTAGYYNDSWRFKKEIADVQRELKIDDRILWRNR